MIIYLYGPDSYRRNQKLKELVGSYREKNSELDLLTLDFEEMPDDWTKAKDFLNQPSMFVESKVLIVKGATLTEEAGWFEVLKANLKTTKTFILLSDPNPPKKALNFLLQEPVKSQFFPELEGGELNAFLMKKIKDASLNFSPAARDFFLEYVTALKERSWLIHHELEKLSLLNLPAPISLSDLKRVIIWSAKEMVFRVASRFLASSDFKEKLKNLEKLIFQKEAPAYIFNSLAYQASGKKAVELANYDISIKSGNLDYEEALTDFLIS